MNTKKIRVLVPVLLTLGISLTAGLCNVSYAMHKSQMVLSDSKIAHDLNNNAIELPNKSGKWTIVNYWTQWCGPCKREIPDLNAFHKNNQDKIVLVGINSDLLDQKTLQKMAKDLKIQFPILQTDPMQLVDSLVGTPSTYLISPSGQVHGPLLGPQSERSLLKAIQKYS